MNEIREAFEKLYKKAKRETYGGVRKEVWETCWRFHVAPLQAEVKKLKTHRYLRGWSQMGVTWASYLDKCNEITKVHTKLTKENDQLRSRILELEANSQIMNREGLSQL